MDPIEPPSLPPERTWELQQVLDTFALGPCEEVMVHLDRAFIHRSYRCEANGNNDNERLELLGDSVIGLVCTEYLLDTYPQRSEGELSKMRASMVSRKILGEVAAELDLGKYLKLGAGEERTGGRARPSTLGSALEAVCGALYMHYPWPDLRAAIVEKVLLSALRHTEDKVLHDYKSILQEWSQKTGEGVPEYRLVDEIGPEHDRIFVSEAWLGDRYLGRGKGGRKKHAENEAARDAVRELGLEGEPDSP